MTIPDALKPRRPRHTTVLMVLGLLALFVVVGVAVLALRTASDSEKQARQTQAADTVAIKQLYAALTATQDQLKAHGITPKAPPPATIVEGIPGAAGQSIVGPQGPAGAAGVSPDPAAIAQLVLAMVHPSPGPKGDPGTPGKDSTVAGPPGVNGQNGANGKDSTTPGPKGDPGAQGPAGPSPSGWTFTAADGTVYDCTPDAAGSTHYSCAARQSPPPPSPSPSPAPSQSATSPKQAAPHRASAPVSIGPGRP